MKIVIVSKEVAVGFEPKDFKFEDPCPETNCVAGRWNGGACSTCEGRGYVVTPIGLHVLDFVFKNAAWYRARKK